MVKKKTTKANKFQKAFTNLNLEVKPETQGTQSPKEACPLPTVEPAPFSMESLPCLSSREPIPRVEGSARRENDTLGITTECPLTFSKSRGDGETSIEWMGPATENITLDPVISFLEENRRADSAQVTNEDDFYAGRLQIPQRLRFG